ncbi:MAG: hypothetical protein Q9191_001159 [Dirinaria sp. TL-2023a]
MAELLLPQLVESRARTDPDAIYAEYLVSPSSYDDGYRKITYADLANAVNGIAWWLHHALGPSRGLETLAYIGPNDLRYPALVLGAGAYLVTFLFNAIPFGTTMIAPISAALPSGSGLVAGLRKTSADVAFIVPSIVQDLSQDLDLLDYCAQHLDAIIYCGGDLPQAIGDIVAAKIKLLNQFGATELGLTPNILSLQDRSNADWKYVQFHPKIGLELRHVADGVFELYAVRKPELKEYQPTFTLFPDRQEYATRDLFVQHPHNVDLWRWKARADDIIVFLNGEKTNPISMEQHVTASNPEVAATLVVGAQRFQAGLLIEPSSAHEDLSTFQRADLIEKIWPSIEEANFEAPSHARILKSHILFTSTQKPMLRAGKGTVQRSGTLKAYESGIEALYRDADQMSIYSGTPAAVGPFSFDEDKFSQCISNTIMSVMSWPQLSESDNFFTLGIDSLHIILLTRKLKQQLRLRNLSPSTIYTNPSVSTLSNAILSMHHQSQATSSTMYQARVKKRNDSLEEYKGYIDQLGCSSDPKESKATNLETVILTGSTGALGSYILDRLLTNPAVGHIYCLNRATDSFALQMERSQARGLKTHFESSKVTFHCCDLTKPELGLSADIYAELLAATTLTVHNAWPVNFNLDLPLFRPQLDGMVNLIDFASKSLKKAHLFFISSISSVMSHTGYEGNIPEQVILGDSSTAANGYAESKYLSEMLLDHAGQKMGMCSSIARVGQLAGAVDGVGAWNAAEWFPSLVISSFHVGALPASLGPAFDSIDWLPIDLSADVVVDLALSGPRAPSSPPAKDASNVLNTAQNVYHLSTKKIIDVVPSGDWLAKVRKEMERQILSSKIVEKADLEKALQLNPAAKLLDFYEEIFRPADEPVSQFELQQTLRLSATLRNMHSLREPWIQRWVAQWLESLSNVSGSAFSTNLIVAADAYTLQSGEPAKYSKPSDAGNTITSYFCKDCGTTLWRETTGMPGKKIVKEGALEKLSETKPAVELYTKRRADWLEKIDGADQKATE